MDLFYYWKDIASDLKSGRIGWFQSNREKLGKLAAEKPEFIWAFKTPQGQKGKLRVAARLAWCREPVKGIGRPPQCSISDLLRPGFCRFGSFRRTRN